MTISLPTAIKKTAVATLIAFATLIAMFGAFAPAASADYDVQERIAQLVEDRENAETSSEIYWANHAIANFDEDYDRFLYNYEEAAAAYTPVPSYCSTYEAEFANHPAMFLQYFPQCDNTSWDNLNNALIALFNHGDHLN